MKKVSLVCQYAQQMAPHFRDLVDYLQKKASECLPGFKPRPDPHFTLIGDEADEVNGKLYNHFFKKECEEAGNTKYLKRPLDLKQLFNFLKDRFKREIIVRFGGYRRDTPYRFRPRGQHPYDRQFYIGTTKPTAAIAGFPTGAPDALDSIRREFQTVNVFQKWPSQTSGRVSDMVSDAYTVFGDFQGAVNPFELADGAAQMRHFMSELSDQIQWVKDVLKPVEVKVHMSTLAIVRYVDDRLPTSSTDIVTLQDLTLDKLCDLYK